MKKILRALICLIIMMPIMNVRAEGIECAGATKKNAIDLNNGDFACKGIESDNVTFIYNGASLTNKYLKVRKSKDRIDIVEKNIPFSKNDEYAVVTLTDLSTGKKTEIYFKNPSYVKPSTTTTTTTTKIDNTKIFTVTLNKNDGTPNETKTCTLTGQNTTCYITLPKLEKENFNGWGTAKTCKIGNSGSIKVEKDITYYACFKETTNISTTNIQPSTLYLKTLSLTNKDTNEELDFGTFSIKKNEYSLKVLNDVKNIAVTTTQDELIKVEIIGNENLNVGENEIIIKLTDDNNNSNEYKIKVTRLEEGENLTNIHFLKSLVIGGYNINFNKEQFVYTLTIPSDIKRLEITPIPEESTAMIEIKGNEALIDGSLITINVIGEDNKITDYTIKIIKEASTNYMLLIAVGIIILLIIILVILIIIKSNKKKQNLKNDNKPKVLNSKNKESNETIETLNI